MSTATHTPPPTAASPLLPSALPPPCRDFDFLIGDWETETTRHGRDGAVLARLPGQWHAEHRHDGRVVLDEFVTRAPALGAGKPGTRSWLEHQRASRPEIGSRGAGQLLDLRPRHQEHTRPREGAPQAVADLVQPQQQPPPRSRPLGPLAGGAAASQSLQPDAAALLSGRPQKVEDRRLESRGRGRMKDRERACALAQDGGEAVSEHACDGR